MVTELLLSRRIAYLVWCWVALQVWLGGPTALLLAILLVRMEDDVYVV